MENLQKLRKSKNLYQRDIAEYLGVAISTVSAWENDVYEIDFNNLKKLADFFDVTVDELIERTSDPKLFDDARIGNTQLTSNLKIKEIRKRLNMTQAEVAEALKIAKTTYSGYETGFHNPTPEILCKLADLYNCSVDELLGHVPAQDLFNDARLPKTQEQELFDSLTDDQKTYVIGYMQGFADLNRRQGQNIQVEVVTNARRNKK